MSSTLATIATKIAAVHTWLAACPLDDAQAMYETAGRHLDDMVAEAMGIAAEMEDQSIAESIVAWEEEGEGAEDDAAFWRHIAAIA